MEVDIKDYFRNGLIPRRIDGFPYPEKFCPYCNQPLTLSEAIHVKEAEHFFKALYICFNSKCGAYDEPARKAYVKVYYSDEEAYAALEGHRIIMANIPRKS